MNKEQVIYNLKEQVRLARDIRQSTKNNPDLSLAKITLKRFQMDRLKETHADLLASVDTYKAANFFLNEIYSSKDLTQRDMDLGKIVPIMEKTFPQNTLETIAQAITLDALTETLDTTMAINLGNNFTNEQYINTFKNYTTIEQRIQQINMVEAVGKSLCMLVKIPFLTTTLKVMRLPAKLANVYSLHEFLETGFTVFKETKNPEKFVETLISRERQILEQIFSKNIQENSKGLKIS